MRHVAVLCALVGWGLVGCGANPPSSLEFVEVVPAQPRIGEIATVRFRATDSRGEPMAGTQITFALAVPDAAVKLSPTTALTNRGTGIAEAQMVVNTRVSSVVVVATAEGSKVSQSPPISFAGAQPSARQFTFQCGSISGNDPNGGVRAIVAYNDTRELIAGVRLNCVAHVGDRNGDGVPNALVSFMTEAGTIGPTQVSKADGVGHALTVFKTSLPLPQEMDPGTFTWTPLDDDTHTGDYLAPLWMEPFNWSQNPIQLGTPDKQEPRRTDPIINARVNNPRDNLVSMIAITSGEEWFEDLNNNGKWDADPAEPVEATTEPFVDNNDNGTWDPGERYSDTNNNGKWDGKNGVFDANTQIWALNRILWTGIPNSADFGGSRPVYRLLAPVTPPDLAHGGSAGYAAVVADPWFNSIAFGSTSDNCEVVGSKVVVSAPNPFYAGVRLSYPSPMRLSFSVADAHEPDAEAFPGPVGWLANIRCTHSFSPLDAATVQIDYPSFTGTVR